MNDTFSKRIYPLIGVFLTLATCASAQSMFEADRRLEPSLAIRGYGSNEYFVSPRSIAVSSRSASLYVCDVGMGAVCVFTLQGIPKARYGKEKGITAPCCAAVAANGDLYVGSLNSATIRIIRGDGSIDEMTIPTADGSDPPRLGRMAFDRDGNLYVTDTANGAVIVVAKNGTVTRRFGRKGGERGEIRAIQGIAPDQLGRSYATSAEGIPAQAFDRDGKYLYRIGFQGSASDEIGAARGVCVDRLGQIWIADSGQNAIKVFDHSGSFLISFGGRGPSDDCSFKEPVDVATDGQGRIYVLEAGERRVQVLTLDKPFEPIESEEF